MGEGCECIFVFCAVGADAFPDRDSRIVGCHPAVEAAYFFECRVCEASLESGVDFKVGDKRIDAL